MKNWGEISPKGNLETVIVLNFRLCFLTYLQERYKADGIIPLLMHKLRFNERIWFSESFSVVNGLTK